MRIKNAKRNSVLNYYLPILTGKEEVEFARDKPYPSIDWEDQGYRILTVYRLWNAIEHGYPYANLTDHRWSTLLAQYLPEFIYASSEKIWTILYENWLLKSMIHMEGLNFRIMLPDCMVFHWD